MHVQCLGAAGQVTGSCHLVEAGGFRILLDCGLVQGRRKDAAANRQPFPFDVSRIDAVVLSHAHIDHSGRIPQLVRQGYEGPIFAQSATRALCDIMLRDSAKIHENDAAYENRRREQDNREPIEPLYTAGDAEAAMKQFRSVRYRRKFEVTPTIRVRFQDAGHILGSSIVELWLTEGSDTRKLVFSGDLGHRDAPLLHDPEFIKQADLVLMESTYGNRDHRSWAETRAEVEEIAGLTTGARGNILIPAFAVGRSQMLLYWLAQNYHEQNLSKWQIYLDSPLAIRATRVYEKYLKLLDPQARKFWNQGEIQDSLPNLNFVRTATQSRALNDIQSGAIIIAGSGMCTGGRIRSHLERNLSRPECHIVIVGFQAAGTPGRRLVDGAKTLRLFGREHPVRAAIHTIGGLSAHAGQSALINWYDQFRERPPVVLVHGEPEAQLELQTCLRDQLAAPVHVARSGERFDLQKPVPF